MIHREYQLSPSFQVWHLTLIYLVQLWSSNCFENLKGSVPDPMLIRAFAKVVRDFLMLSKASYFLLTVLIVLSSCG